MRVCEYIWINKFPSRANSNFPLTSETLPRCMGEHFMSLIATFRVKEGTRLLNNASRNVLCIQSRSSRFLCYGIFFGFLWGFWMSNGSFGKVWAFSRVINKFFKAHLKNHRKSNNKKSISYFESINIQDFHHAFFACHAESTFAMCRLIFFRSTTLFIFIKQQWFN